MHVARAEDSATEAARLHFQNALRLYDTTPPDFAGALAEFEASFHDKPAASTRLNMAVCLRALRRYPEAIDTLRAVLADTRADITPDARHAAERAVTEMEALVGTIRVEITGGPARGLEVILDGEPRPYDPSTPLRVPRGTHVLTVRAAGFVEPPPAKVAVMGNGTTSVSFTLAAEVSREGTLVFRGEWPNIVDVDGTPAVTNAPLRTSAGVHRVSIRNEGRVVWLDVSVDAGEERSIDAPSESDASLHLDRGVDAAFPKRNWYVRGGPSLSGELFRFGAAAGEPAEGTTRTLYGPAFAVAAGRNVSELFSVELAGDVGTAWRNYELSGGTARAQVDTWAIVPALRFHTKGSARFTSAIGVGVAGRSANITRPGASAGNTITTSGGGTTGTLFLDAGADIYVGRVFLHGAIFANGFRLAPITGVADTRPFEGEVSLRTGARIEVGFDF